MEPQVREELADVLQEFGPPLQRAMIARAPRKTGRLQSEIKVSVARKSLRLRVGFLGRGVGSRTTRFYARILEFGRKAQVVQVRRRKVGVNHGLHRGRKIAGDVAATYSMRVRRIAPMRFVTGPMTDIRSRLLVRLRGVFDAALRKTATGGLDD